MRFRVLLLAVCFLASLLSAQAWTGPVQLTNSSGNDINPSMCKEWVNGSYTYLVWQTNRNGNWDIYGRMADVTEWHDELPICRDSADDVNPVVAACNSGGDSSFWCAWEQLTSDTSGSIMVSSVTGADSWGPPVRVGGTIHPAGVPAGASMIVIKGGALDTAWVIWCNQAFGESYISYAYYDGTSWSDPQVAYTSNQGIQHARIGRGCSPRHGNVPYPLLVWEQADSIFFSEYVSSQWSTPKPVAPSPGLDQAPEVISYPMNGMAGAHITWESIRNGDTAIYGTEDDSFSVASRWCNASGAGANYEPAGTAAAFPTRVQVPGVVVWVSDRNGNPDIYSGLGYGDVFVDTNSATDSNPTVTASDLTAVWCCWQSNRTGNWHIFGSYIYETAVAETRPATELNSLAVPGIVRGVLQVGLQLTAYGSRPEIGLYDANGRKVAALHPGANDVSRFGVGVYFVRGQGSGFGGQGEVRKVVIAK